MFDLNLSGSQFADSLVEISGGMELLNSKIGFYYENFFSETERTENVLSSTSEAMNAFNEEFNTSIYTMENLREVIESISDADLQTQEGAEFFNALLNLAPVVVQNSNAFDQLNQALTETQDQIFDLYRTINNQLDDLTGKPAQLSRLQIERAALVDAATEAFRTDMERYELAVQANETIMGFLRDMSISSLNNISPGERLQNAQNLFNDAVSRGNTSDASGFGRQYLEIAQQYYASTGAYTDIFNSVNSAMAGMLNSDAAVKPIEDETLARIDAQIDLLELQIQQEEDALALQTDIRAILQNLFDLSIQTGVPGVALGSNLGIGLNEFSVARNILGSDNFWQGFLQMGMNANLTTSQLANTIGVNENQVLGYLNEIGVSSSAIQQWNQERGQAGFSSIDSVTSGQLSRIGVSSNNVQTDSEIAHEMRLLREEIANLRAVNTAGFNGTIDAGQRQANAQEEMVEMERIR